MDEARILRSRCPTCGRTIDPRWWAPEDVSLAYQLKRGEYWKDPRWMMCDLVHRYPRLAILWVKVKDGSVRPDEPGDDLVSVEDFLRLLEGE